MGTTARISLVTILVLPLVLHVLTVNDAFGLGLTWLLSHQVYYAPMAWLGEPFFMANDDIGFFVQPVGRLAVAVTYAAIFMVARKAFILLRHSLRRPHP